MSVVQTAYQYIGTPYVWGGTTPSGFDCSGLVQYSFNQNGVYVPRTSQEQFAYTANSRITDPAQLQAGDLVFFKGYTNSSTNPGHVGIYIGNGQYIEAPKSGDVVKVSNLSSRPDFVGGGRVAGGESAPLSGVSTSSADSDLTFLGKIIAFLTVLGVAILAVVFFAKAFDIPTSKGELITRAIQKKTGKKAKTVDEKPLEDLAQSIDEDITTITEEIKN